jgi:preprotein translocase SecE subunit
MKLIIWAAIALVVFAFAWKKGLLARLAQYFAETREELKKCTWPTKEELKGSTVVVLISSFLLGFFTIAVDMVISYAMRHLLS